MIVWTVLFGAFVGWFWVGFEIYGFFVGSLIGWVCGAGLKRAIRAEVDASTKARFAELDERLLALRPDSSARAPRDSETDYRPLAAEQSRVREPVDFMSATQTQEDGPDSEAVVKQDAETLTEPNTRSIAPNDTRLDAPNQTAKAISTAFGAVREWLFGGNTIVRVGLIVLFVGLSFLASYAASAGLFPVEVRLALVGAFGAGLLTVGFRTRLQKPYFGLALQGSGVATIYLTLFAATRLIDGFPILAALGLMILVCALGCALALLQRSQVLAVTAFTGGFAVPLLLSTGAKDPTALFVYYTVLNVAIGFIAQQRSWRVLNLIGFVATFGVLTLLLAGGYDPKLTLGFQTFLIISVLIYVAIAVFYTANTPSQIDSRFGNAVDTTLLFGTALVGFGLEARRLEGQPFGTAFAALAIAGLYIGVAALIGRRQHKTNLIITDAMLAIGIGFVTLAIPLALGARWTSAAWALEGAGAFWVGMRQARWLPRLFGLVLQAVAAIVYVVGMGPNIAALPLANPAFMGAILIALEILATAWWLRRALPHNGGRLAILYGRGEGFFGKPVFLIGFAFWWLAWAIEINRMLPARTITAYPTPVFDFDMQFVLMSGAFVVSAWGFQNIGRRQQWQVAIWPSAASLAALVLGFIAVFVVRGHVVHAPECLIWLIAITVHGRMLYVNDHDNNAGVARPLLVGAHICGVWLGTAMLADTMLLAIDKGALWGTSWAGVSLLASGVAVLLGLTFWATRRMRCDATTLSWPLDRYCDAYGWVAALPIAGLVSIGALVTATFASGNTDPLPYIPFLNPVDLMVALALASVVFWRRNVIATNHITNGKGALSGASTVALLAAMAFIGINTVWLRISHHLLGVDWSASSLYGSFIIQTGLAILWTTLALPLMVIAHRRSNRTLWLAGAGLLGLTVLKLVLIDLNNTGGGARIIAFIAVGVLMLVVGYLAPLPPRVIPTQVKLEVETSSEGK